MIYVRPNRPKGIPLKSSSSSLAAAGSGGDEPPEGGDDPLPVRDFDPGLDEEADLTPPEEELLEFVHDRDADFKNFNTQKRKLRHFRDGLM